MQATKKELEALYKSFDADKNGSLDFSEVSKLHANLTGAASAFETSAAARHVIERSKLFRRRAALIHAALVAQVAQVAGGEAAGAADTAEVAPSAAEAALWGTRSAGSQGRGVSHGEGGAEGGRRGSIPLEQSEQPVWMTQLEAGLERIEVELEALEEERGRMEQEMARQQQVCNGQ